MNFKEAELLTLEYINKHLSDDWKFQWMGRSKRTLGQCDSREKLIKLSSKYVELNKRDVVERTIIHEIAHALTLGHGHDKVWKRKCIELGGDGRRVNTEAVPVPEKYIAFCPNGHEQYVSKIYKDIRSCGKCSNRFDERFIVRYKINPNYEK